jgi:hypothetical protein
MQGIFEMISWGLDEELTTLLPPIFARHVGILPLNLRYPFVILPLVQTFPPTRQAPHYTYIGAENDVSLKNTKPPNSQRKGSGGRRVMGGLYRTSRLSN